jgi:predicted dehydrogenase
MAAKGRVRVGIYGTGNWANRTHLPNLSRIDCVDIVAACDQNAQALSTTAAKFDIPATYADGHELLKNEDLDVLFSVIPAFSRTDVEIAAVKNGVHLFSEKPQTIELELAKRIDEAIRSAGVISTVGFRERYRPLFQEAKRLLGDEQIVHVAFKSVGSMPEVLDPDGRIRWTHQMEKAGGSAFDWGVHAVDYMRFVTGLEVEKAQAFYLEKPDKYYRPLSSSFNFLLSNHATMSMSFVSADAHSTSGPWFTFYFEGGRLELFRYERIKLNGKTVFKGEDFDPWFAQDKIFIDSVLTGETANLLNDYHDGLYSLAPVLAGWESAKGGGTCHDVVI